MPNPGHRFTKKQRLRKPSEFREVFKSNRRIANNDFIILIQRNGLDVARLGVSVPSKHIRLATARNRIKRLIKEHFRHSRDSVKGLDVVVVAKTGINSKNRSKIARSLTDQWKKINNA